MEGPDSCTSHRLARWAGLGGQRRASQLCHWPHARHYMNLNLGHCGSALQKDQQRSLTRVANFEMFGLQCLMTRMMVCAWDWVPVTVSSGTSRRPGDRAHEIRRRFRCCRAERLALPSTTTCLQGTPTQPTNPRCGVSSLSL